MPTEIPWLDAIVKDAGYDTSEVLISCVPFPDEVILGGGGGTA